MYDQGVRVIGIDACGWARPLRLVRAGAAPARVVGILPD